MNCPAMDGIQCIDPTCARGGCMQRPSADGFKLVDLPPGEQPVGMCVHNGEVIVATTGGVYRLVHDRIIRIPFEVPA